MLYVCIKGLEGCPGSSVANSPINTKVLKPCPYTKDHDTILIENLWDLIHYVDINISLEMEKIFLVNLYPSDHTMTC